MSFSLPHFTEQCVIFMIICDDEFPVQSMPSVSLRGTFAVLHMQLDIQNGLTDIDIPWLFTVADKT